MLLTRTLRFVLATAPALALCAIGCDPAGGPLTAPLMDFTAGPSTPGPFIVRIPGAGSRVVTTDPEDGLLAIHGKVSDLAACTDASTRVLVDIQIVRTPADAQAINLLLVGSENEVAIYNEGSVADLVPFDPDKFCPFINDHVPVYSGTVRYRLSQVGGGNLLFQWNGFVRRTADGASLPYVELQYAVPRDGALNFLIEDIRVLPAGGNQDFPDAAHVMFENRQS